MAVHKKALLAAFAPAFKQAGFKKTAATWKRATPEVIHIFNVQTSQWSEQYMFNVWLYLPGLDPETKGHLYHIGSRVPHGSQSLFCKVDELSDFAPDETRRKRTRDHWRQQGIEVMSDIEAEHLTPESKIEALAQIIPPLAFKWFDRFQNLEHIKNELGKDQPDALVTRYVWPFLGITPR